MTSFSTNVAQYGLMAMVAGLMVYRVVTKIIARRRIPGLLRGGAVIIDDRSTSEFSAGHAAGSRNIPLGNCRHPCLMTFGRGTILGGERAFGDPGAL
jgi:hypothetical protein